MRAIPRRPRHSTGEVAGEAVEGVVPVDDKPVEEVEASTAAWVLGSP